MNAINYVAFSGGIDSTALALAMPEAIPVFSDTGWEFDELYRHIERFEQITGRRVEKVRSQHGTLPNYIRTSKYLPGHRARFCTRMFKIEPMNNWLASHLPATLCIGLRADEPADMRIGNLSEIEGLSIDYPYRRWGWTRRDCILKCLEYNLLPRYPVYMARGGCKGCFYKRYAEVKAMAQLVPDILDELGELETEVQDERNSMAIMFPNAGRTIAEIQAQPALFDLSEVYKAAGDNSDKEEACGLFCHR